MNERQKNIKRILGIDVQVDRLENPHLIKALLEVDESFIFNYDDSVSYSEDGYNRRFKKGVQRSGRYTDGGDSGNSDRHSESIYHNEGTSRDGESRSHWDSN